jgi:hypothetical protein
MSARLLFAAILASAGAMGSQDAAPTPAAAPALLPVGPDAVWKPPADFNAAFHKACAKAGARFGLCFTQQMEKAGASPAAVAFSRRIENQGYLRAFRETGKVDVAYADYPYRANENQVCLLVNGQPPTIDVDDPALIDKAALAASPVYAELLRSHPNATLFPGSRGGARGPIAQDLASGGQRFMVPFTVHDGCHACAVLGQVYLRFLFDVEGRFLGTEVERVGARPN